MKWSQFAFAALGLGALAMGCASDPSPVTSPVAAKAKPLAVVDPAKAQFRSTVTNLYNDNCSNCHGVHGEGGGAGTQTLLTTEKFDQSQDRPFFDAIKKGVPTSGMAAFGDTMSDETVWALVVHIRELQRDARPQFDPYPKPDGSGITPTKLVKYKTEDVLTDTRLRTPWAIDWLPDGTMLVTNRPGFMYLVRDKKVVAEVHGLPRSVELGQGGLMQVKVHPDYAKNGWIYLTIADPKPGDDRSALTKLVRGKLEIIGSVANWVEQETVFKADFKFYNGAGIHFGSKIVFDGKGHLYFNIGERGQNEGSRHLDNPYGKIYRLNEDGTAPADNPFRGQGNEITDKIWTWGHRNPQGLVLDLEGNLWNTEHGPRGGDELNLDQPGHDYGWPMICYGIGYNDSPFRVPWARNGEDYTMPVYRWLPSRAESGLACVDKGPFSAWRGDLLAGGLAGQSVDRIKVRAGKLIEVETVWKDRGRVRDVAMGPDGYVYIVLNRVDRVPDKIVRIVPVG